MIVARKSSDDNKSGETIGGQLDAAMRYCDQSGLKPRLVVAVLNTSGRTHFESRQDFGEVFEAFRRGETPAGARVLSSKDDYAASGISFMIAGDGALRDRAKRAAIADYLARQRRALAWGLAHPDQWIAAVQKESRLPEEVARGARIAQRIELVPITAQIVAQEQRLADILARHGVVKAVRVGPLVENLLR